MEEKSSIRDFKNAQKRRQFLEKKLNISLINTGQFSFKENEVLGRNIENLVGATQIPLGVSGPLTLKILRLRSGQATSSKLKTYYIPLATTEGALVASISRGCKAITEAHGATVYVEDAGMSRGPVFKTRGLEDSLKVKEWIETHFNLLSQTTQKTSSRLKLLRIKTALAGSNLWVRFVYSTSLAMGMNMVTIATQKAVNLIEKETQARCVSLAGNFDIDKKAAWLNFLEGRGKKVWAEVLISKKVVKDVLKTTPSQILQVVYRKNNLGSIMSGSLGFNGHFANILAAIFIATGQDPAHVVEGSLGITTAESLKGDLQFSIYLPALAAGIIGGGTSLPTQKEALKMMQVSDVLEYCQAVGGAVLAGELSLMASLAEGTLAKAHEKLGRRISTNLNIKYKQSLRSKDLKNDK